jgi:transposase-like protein
MPHKKHRTFTTAFKVEVVLELISGQKSAAELCREHELSATLLQNWKDTFLENAERAFPSRKEQSPDAARVADLERALGQATLENTILKKASSLLNRSKGKL